MATPGGEPSSVNFRRFSSAVLCLLVVAGGIAAAGPRQKQCFGNPPRQSEDPLSPPCVAYFDGDNGGATSPGVTRDEIRVTLYNSLGLTGDLSGTPSDAQENPAHPGLVRTVKAQLRYFSDRYLTYGRSVRLVARANSGATCLDDAADAAATDAVDRAFAAVHLGAPDSCYAAAFAAQRGVTFTYAGDLQKTVLDASAPYVYSMMPSDDTESYLSAAFVCHELKGHRARRAASPTLSAMTRKFGLVSPLAPATRADERLVRLAGLFAKYLKTCGIEPVQAHFASRGPASVAEAASIVATMSAANVTTMICYCDDLAPGGQVHGLEQAATALGYAPEWYWDQASGFDQVDVEHAQSATLPLGSFGTTPMWLQREPSAQYHAKAYASIEPGVAPNARWNFEIYQAFQNLFTAIQSAGPQLTPETVERGMFTFNYMNRADPYVPVGGYGQYGKNAISDYSFVDTGMSWWWDPLGTEPGATSASGCQRAGKQGARRFAREWPANDAELFVASAPCTAPVRGTEIAPL
jgi:hypothetical protein